MEDEKSEQESGKTSKSQENTQATGEKDVNENKFWAVLSYLGVLVIIPLLLKKDSKFVHFHTKQGLILLVGWVLSWLPFGPIIGLIALVFSIIGIINVLNGEMKKLPVIGDLSQGNDNVLVQGSKNVRF